MIVLPTPPRRAHLRGFGLLLGIGLSVPATILGAWSAGPAIGALGAVPLLVLTGLARWRPEGLAPFYETWNRIAKRVARWTGLWFSLLAFLVVLSSAGGASPMTWRRPRPVRSGWRPRPTTGLSEATPPADRAPGAFHWIGPSIDHARATGTTWIWALVPFLALIGTVEIRPKGGVRGNIYTLY
jgi:hypothetical protein